MTFWGQKLSILLLVISSVSHAWHLSDTPELAGNIYQFMCVHVTEQWVKAQFSIGQLAFLHVSVVSTETWQTKLQDNRPIYLESQNFNLGSTDSGSTSNHVPFGISRPGFIKERSLTSCLWLVGIWGALVLQVRWLTEFFTLWFMLWFRGSWGFEKHCCSRLCRLRSLWYHL